MERKQGGRTRDRSPSLRLDTAESTPAPAVIRYAALQRARARATAASAGSAHACDNVAVRPNQRTVTAATSFPSLCLRRQLQQLRRLIAKPVLLEEGAGYWVEQLAEISALAEAATEELYRLGSRRTVPRRIVAMVRAVEDRTAQIQREIEAANTLRQAALEYQVLLDWFVRVGGLSWAKLLEIADRVHQASSAWPTPVLLSTEQNRFSSLIATQAVSVARVARQLCTGHPGLEEVAEWAVLAALLADIGCLTLADTDYCVPLHTEGRYVTHPLRSAQVARALRTLPVPVIRAIEEHHELGDGSGSPAGKRAEELSVLGQVLAIATAFVDRHLSRVSEPGPVAKQQHGLVLGELKRMAGAGKLNAQLLPYLPDAPPVVLRLKARPHFPTGCGRMPAAA